MTTRHDDMDGGVTAARIEKEAASPAVDYEAMWWQAERDREQAKRMAALWKEVARRNFQYRVLVRTGREFHKTRADKAEENVLAREEMANRLYVRARQAEKERDMLLDDLRKAEYRAERAERRLKDLSEAYNRQSERLADLRDTQPRPLTADDITDDMVERARRVYPLSTKRVRDVLTAALTEPQRPEGAGPIEALLREIEGVGFVTDPVLLSRHLAERGVRVTEGEQ